MKKVFEIFSANKYAIIWTLCYIFAMWAILYFMFGFSIFNGTQWNKLIHAQLRGFAGFVFGLLILSALPLYIATTTLIIRTKKPLISVPTPKINFPKFFIEPKQVPAPAPTPSPAPPSDSPAPDATPEQKLPDDLPPELHAAFLRARTNINHMEIKSPNTTPQPNAEESAPDVLPLPSDFDIQLDDVPGFDDTPNFSAPVFTDVNFDTPAPQDAETTAPTPNPDITKHLTQRGIAFTTIDDVIITDKYAIISHDDKDFWVTDNENWFAAGKTRPSPINTVLGHAHAHNVTPVLYLASHNIMDLDQMIPTWQSNGIIIITSPDEI